MAGNAARYPTPATRSPADSVEAAQRLAREAWFVGRERELADFAGLLADGSSTRVVFIHGPGGIGKSNLLAQFHRTAEQLAVDFAYLDARLLPAQPEAVRRAIEEAIPGVREPASVQRPRVLALDHVEQLSPLDGWLRTEVLPRLPAGLVLVLATRQRPDAQWRADPALIDLMYRCELGPLDPETVSEYLRQRGVPDGQHDAVQRFTRGHPLALALAVDQVLNQPDKPFNAAACPDLIHDLVTWLLRDADDPRHAEAVAACATVRSLNEPLLAAMLGQKNAREPFDWLAGQPFVDRQATGLVIHDLVREVVVHDLRARDLERHHALIRRAAGHLLDGLEGAGQETALSVVRATIYTLRHESYVKRQFPFGDAQCYPDTARPDEIPGLKAEVKRLEGVESAAWFEHWFSHEDANLLVLRDSGRTPVAAALALRFGTAELEAGSDDPCIRALFRYLSRHAPLRGREEALLVRFLFAHGTRQARTPVWAELVAQLNGLMFTPGISILAWASDLAYDWEDISDMADAQVLPDSEYRIGGRRYAITAHDIRREPPLEWARNCVERIIRDGDAPELQPPELVLLDRPAFEDAVARALRAFHDDAALAENPLLKAPMLRLHGSRRDPEDLRRLIRTISADRLSASQHQVAHHDVLTRIYFEPGAKQLAAAAALNTSERTLRRRLREAEARLVDALWELETGTDSAPRRPAE